MKIAMEQVKVFGPGQRARCAWEVRAGVIPGAAMPEHTRRFVVTSDGFYADNDLTAQQFKEKYPDGRGLFKQAQHEAQEYFLSLQNPTYLNWMDLTWIWY